MSGDTSINKNNSDDQFEIKENEKSKLTNSLNVSQNKMVRTDCSEQKIDKFLSTNDSSSMLKLPKSKTDEVITRYENYC